MTPAEANAVLNRISAVHQCSLPMYLSYAPPWIEQDHPETAKTLAKIADEQRTIVRRLGELVAANRGGVVSVQPPAAYTALNDLSIDYLKEQLVQLQQRDVAEIESCANQLAECPTAEAAAQAALTSARQHLEWLRELPMPTLKS
jgi:hypothetical protein